MRQQNVLLQQRRVISFLQLLFHPKSSFRSSRRSRSRRSRRTRRTRRSRCWGNLMAVPCIKFFSVQVDWRARESRKKLAAMHLNNWFAVFDSFILEEFVLHVEKQGWREGRCCAWRVSKVNDKKCRKTNFPGGSGTTVTHESGRQEARRIASFVAVERVPGVLLGKELSTSLVHQQCMRLTGTI